MLGILGQGGFGVVYRARQLAVRREVALKVDNRVLVSERDRRRFMREVSSAGALSGHPHVADVYDAGVLPDGRPYMVLELCPGGSLADRLRERGPLPPAEVRDIGVRVADALAAAHAAGVLHRDVKPANILLNQYGMVALSDFGLAATGHAGGEVSVTRESLTPAFGPPEAFELAEPSPAGDVYSLAATLYALLSGRPPRFPESGVVNVAMIMALHRLPVPEIPGVPPRLTAVLRAGLAADPRDRLPSAAALRDALTSLPAEIFSSPQPPAPSSPPPGPHATPSSGPYAASSRPPGAARPYGSPLSPSGPSGPRSGPGGRHGASGGWSGDTGPRDVSGPGVRDRTGPGSGTRDRTGPGSGAVRPGGRGEITRPPAPPVARPRQARLYGTVAALFAVLLAVGVTIAWFESRGPTAGADGTPGASGVPGRDAGPGPSASGGQAADAFGGVPVTTANCPATLVTGAGAACAGEAECWGGIVAITGAVSVRRRACEESHVWETFAVAPLPKDAMTFDLADLEAHPVVKRLCSSQVMLRSRTGTARSIPSARWMVSVLPPSPDAFKEGIRVYRCVGAVTGRERPGTYFRAAT
nr:serine/threonine-protein kinase [Sphaerisporangium rubeum]